MNQQVASNIIIAGTTKSGTGSLFNYLGDHPALCPSNIKETRFFLGVVDYELPIKYSITRDGINAYERFFNHCDPAEMYLEATPDYLYSSETAEYIREFVRNPRLIFILRNPIDRLVSWYRFAVQQSLIEEGTHFSTFVSNQFDWVEERYEPAAQCMHSLHQGRYSQFLEPFLARFSKEELCITRFEKMVDNEHFFMMGISNFCGIDGTFYDEYRFDVVNRTRTMRRLSFYASYVQIRRAVRMRVHDVVWLKAVLRTLRKLWEPIYFRLATKKETGIEIDPSLLERLNHYYEDDQHRLEQIYGEYDCVQDTMAAE